MAGLKQLNWASEGVGATAAALVDLSTVAGNKISNPPWVKFQSAGWVNFPSAPTQWVLEGDIRGCFDNISHDWLLANVPMDKAVLRKWLRAGYVDQGALFATEAGTPQGGIISPILANWTLDG
ncbi:MAG: reverse transcriptase domain-containing protein, partial [Cyanobacteria bacterium MAG COS4_bin_21]|nr:reverse transcriptase domain-containing protein [Cyanobacteria bacterium MAG COS4_bin_21]